VEPTGPELTVNATKLAQPMPTVVVNLASRIWLLVAEEVHPTLLLMYQTHQQEAEAFLA